MRKVKKYCTTRLLLSNLMIKESYSILSHCVIFFFFECILSATNGMEQFYNTILLSNFNNHCFLFYAYHFFILGLVYIHLYVYRSLMCIIINVEASKEAKNETSIALQGRKLAINNISNLNLTFMP